MSTNGAQATRTINGTVIPVVDPSEIPFMVKGGHDEWRQRYDVLREKYPFFVVGDEPTIWFTRYDACREIFANGDLFWAGAFQEPDAPKRMEWDDAPAWDHASAEAAVQRHIEVRKVLMPKYSPAQAARWEGRMEEVCNELIDRFQSNGEADFVIDFARYYFPYIGCEMIGVPREDWDLLVEWEHEVFKMPADATADHMLNLQNEAMDNIVNYVNGLLEKNRDNPDDSFVGYILKAQKEGKLTEEEVRWAATILVLGSGHTVTSHLGYVFKHFAEHPEMQQRVLEHPDKINTTCEELLRMNSLFGHTRTVTKDMEFHGCNLRKGDDVFICYTIPNRDPRVEGHDHTDYDRSVFRHLAMNFGWKQCLGMHYARRARNIAVKTWHERIPTYKIREGTELVEQIYAGVGYHNLPLEWKT